MTKKTIRQAIRKKLGIKKRLYKTTIVIWSDYPGDSVELEDLARQATSGDAICTQQTSKPVDRPWGEPDFDDSVGAFFEIGLSNGKD